jgi:hypothetical protein
MHGSPAICMSMNSRSARPRLSSPAPCRRAPTRCPRSHCCQHTAVYSALSFVFTASAAGCRSTSHQTVTGHEKAGTGYRNECQAEKLRPLTNQSGSVSPWCALSQIGIRRSKESFPYNQYLARITNEKTQSSKTCRHFRKKCLQRPFR